METAFELPAGLAPTTDLTDLVQRQLNDRPLHWTGDSGYQQLHEQIARVFHRGPSHHVVLVSEPGVDPASFLVEFAQRAAQNWLPFLSERRIVLIDASYTLREQSRDRLLAILQHVAQHPSLIVCIRNFAELMRAERGSNREALLAALGNISAQLIVLMEPTEYDEWFSGDAQIDEFFTRVELPEPSLELVLRLLAEDAQTLSERFEVKIAPEVVHLTATLAANYILHERLPGKARKILHRVCQELSFERTQLGQERLEVTVDDVITAVSASTGVPAETLRGIAEKRDYEQSLKEFIIGQDHAVREVATELGLIKAGFTDSCKPASVMLFMGQTGTGKTEMAKALSRFYSNTKRLRTYTLGNMVEPHSVSAIIGVPPGYVGHDAGGKIVHDLHADPHCVFLLDEADKAHPDVLQPFLNLFDEGWIRDQRGVQAYANKAIFILTTNVGQRMIADMAKQGKTPEEMATRMKETLAQIKHAKLNRPVFAPEFLARLKRVIVFQPLSQDTMHAICHKELSQTQAHWTSQRGKELSVDDLLVQSIGEEAHRRNDKSDGKEGGRIVGKLLSEYVDAPLQRAISEQPQEYTEATNVHLQAAVPADWTPPETTGEDSEPDAHVPPAQLEITVKFGGDAN